MNYKLLGRSGLRLSELALGTMTFGEDWGFGASKDESQKIFNAFVKAVGTLLIRLSIIRMEQVKNILGHLFVKSVKSLSLRLNIH